MGRNYIKDWLIYFPMWKINQQIILRCGNNLGQWQNVLIHLLGTPEYNHPLTVVMFQHVTPQKFCKHIAELCFFAAKVIEDGKYSYATALYKSECEKNKFGMYLLKEKYDVEML